MQALLSFDKTPPFEAPLRFFLSAPLFGMLAGLLLLVEGEDLLASRWTPGALAATHLLTVGFMLQIMLGALIQVLPVVAGANLRRPAQLAAWLHPALNIGALLLAAGFYWHQPGLLQGAAGLLGSAVACFLLASWAALRGVPSTSPTIRGVKLALWGLLAVATLGILLVAALTLGWRLPLIEAVDLHAAWGLAGWSGVLLAAVAYVVVPMFQLTPGYPARPGWLFPPLVIGLLSLWSLGVVLDRPALVRVALWALLAICLAFAGLTLKLQGQRRRARHDATSRYWQFALATAILALLMPALAALAPQLAAWNGWAPWLGVLILLGAFPSFIVGMLYKIVPFLAWMHLQNLGLGKVPNMKQLLPDLHMQRQMLAWVATVCLTLAAVVWPAWLARPAGLALLLASGALGFNLFMAVRRYHRHALGATR